MKIEKVKTKYLKSYEKNAKIHTREQIEEIKRSIEQFGNNDPIAIDENNMIIEGHGRLQALQELGYEEVECIRLTHLTPDQKRAYILVHNKLTMDTGFDLDILTEELEGLAIDMSDFHFDLDFGELDKGGADWFEDHESGADTEGASDEYKEFVEKFEPKLTTDDCYTPGYIFDVIAAYVEKQYGLDRAKFVRPFYPGGDYQREKYKPGTVVVDNPPFSILSEIIKFYTDRGIRFFLFAPGLTAFTGAADGKCCVICAGYDLVYENGARICTSYITNLENTYQMRTAPDLYEAIDEAVHAFSDLTKRERGVHDYPPHVITSSMLNRLSQYGVDFRVPMGECVRIRVLDEQKQQGQKAGIFGSGYLLSDRLAEGHEIAEQDADRNAARKLQEHNRAAGNKWSLSERERAIVESLNTEEEA